MSNTFTKPCWKKQFKLKHMLNTDEKCGTQLKIQMYEISHRGLKYGYNPVFTSLF
uniref:Uncharacterized protein n=1 Tax=Anguilla anguilla TaxID=7936 RepID=A0A0E9X686_ANGAN